MSATGATAPGRPRGARRAVALPGRRMARRLVALVAASVLLVAGYLLLLRDSSLVGVDRVTVTGLAGPGSERIRAALTSTARDMTTLHVDKAELERAVAGFPVVRAIEVVPDFPSAMRIRVVQHRPAALLVAGTRRVPVAGDGTVLAGVPVKGHLPLIRTAGELPAKRVAAGATRASVRVAGGIPDALRSRVKGIERNGGKGVVVPLTDGPRLIFGDASRTAAKWAAAVRVLGDPDAAGAAYIDVRIPERPAAGGLPVETVTPLAPAGAPASGTPAPAQPEPSAEAVTPPPSAGSSPASPGAVSPAAPAAPDAPTPRVQAPPSPAVAEGGGTAPNTQP